MRERELIQESNYDKDPKSGERIGRFRNKLGIGASAVLALGAITAAVNFRDKVDASQHQEFIHQNIVGEMKLGDADCDGDIDSVDALQVLRKVAGLVDTLPCEESADVDGNKSINSVDALHILRKVAGIIDHFPGEITPTPTEDPTVAPTPTPTELPTPTATPFAKILLEAEDNFYIPGCSGELRPRSNASSLATVWFRQGGDYCQLNFNIPLAASYDVLARYSNDGGGDFVDVTVDGVFLGQFETVNTREPGASPGTGWNVFKETGDIGRVDLPTGDHEILVEFVRWDGMELDVVILNRVD